jgi:uncharacterized 2Fe-2S/4Fe-4S cluster protein (DUF4445 family)
MAEFSTWLTVIDGDGREHEVPVRPGLTLAQVVFAGGVVPVRALCSGLGRCGRCRVRFEDTPQASKPPEPVEMEERLLSPEELEQGWRLACRHVAQAGMRVSVPTSASPALADVRTATESDSLSGVSALRMAVDLGTTSLHWKALPVRSGTGHPVVSGDAVASGRELNPQLGVGSEIMSRMAYAVDSAGAEELQRLVLDRLRDLTLSLPLAVDEMCLAGNPAMVYLLQGHSVRGLAAAPYSLDWKGGDSVALDPELPPAYIPPLFGPFVGADLSAGLAYILFDGEEPEYPFLLADLGTNAECILAVAPDQFLAASAPLGPALEGIGLSYGSVAGPGVVGSFRLTAAGLVPTHLPEDRQPGDKQEEPGITGAGYLSLVHCLLRAGVLGRDGRFVSPESASPLARKLLVTLKEPGQKSGDEPRLPLPEGMYLAASDVEEILKVKAAFNAALSGLFATAGIEPGGLATLYLAGAMGEHTAPEDLTRLGFIPPELGKVTRVAGNASLAGAVFFLTQPEARGFIEALVPKVRVLDLASQPAFATAYLERMVFEYVS